MSKDFVLQSALDSILLYATHLKAVRIGMIYSKFRDNTFYSITMFEQFLKGNVIKCLLNNFAESFKFIS